MFRIGRNTFYDPKNKILMKIPEFKRPESDYSRNSMEFQTDFPTKPPGGALLEVRTHHQLLTRKFFVPFFLTVRHPPSSCTGST
jgi:hypothetical protein